MNKYFKNPFPCEKSWGFLLHKQKRQMLQSLRQCGGKWANQGRDTGKNALQGFLTVSLGLNTFSVREEMLEPCSGIRYHWCSSSKVLAFAN